MNGNKMKKWKKNEDKEQEQDDPDASSLNNRTAIQKEDQYIVNSSTTIGYNLSCELRLQVPEYPQLGGM